jgi:imidazolonepropionase-like amidohydrolase
MHALQVATFNAAKFFNKLDSLGTIEKGKLADLVLLDSNPLDDIGNKKKINSVVLNGRLFDRTDLDKLLADIEDAAKSK